MKRFLRIALFFLVAFLISNSAPAQTITPQLYLSNDKALLNDVDFTSYQTISIAGLGTGFVNLGQCSDLHFFAYITPTSSLEKHTFTAWLKRDGIEVQKVQKQFGPFFSSKTLLVDFAPEEYKPGNWTIEWHWAVSSGNTGAFSIKLAAPAVANYAQTTYPPAVIDQATQKYLFCDRGNLYSAAFTNGLCQYRQIPPTGFIFANSYYRGATITSSSCPFGVADPSGVCFVTTTPRKAYIRADGNVYFYPLNSGFFGGIPSYPFCPQALNAAQQGAGPYSVTPVPFVGCKIDLPPSWWQRPILISAFTGWSSSKKTPTKVYFTPRKTGTCAEGIFDGANCKIDEAPQGTQAVTVGNYWYWTPKYCD